MWNANRKQKYKCISRKQKQEKTSRNNQCFDMIYAFTNKSLHYDYAYIHEHEKFQYAEYRQAVQLKYLHQYSYTDGDNKSKPQIVLLFFGHNSSSHIERLNYSYIIFSK